MHLDNQFRLLREDLLGELRSDFQIATGQKKGRRKLILDHLEYAGIGCGSVTRRKPCALELLCTEDLPQLRGLENAAASGRYISENRNVLKHQSLGCLISNGDIVAFATVERDESLLAHKPSIIVLRITGAASFSRVLTACKTGQELQFVQVDTAVFAYEPTLKFLQSMDDLPLEDQLLNREPTSGEVLSGIQPTGIVESIRNKWEQDLQDIIGTTKSVKVDTAQMESLLTGLTKRLSLIQGPPGE